MKIRQATLFESWKVWLQSLSFTPLHYILLRISLFTKRISFLLTSLNTPLGLLV